MLFKEKYIGTYATMNISAAKGPYVHSLAETMLYTPQKLCKEGEYIKYITAGCSYHQLARNNLVEHMEGEWLFQSDTDHQHAGDLLIRLLRLAKRYNAKVISGIYQYKYPPFSPVACVWTAEGNKAHNIQDWNRNKEVLQLDGAVGGGCLLVFREVFDRIKNELHEQPFTEYNGLSEDYSFCHRCKRLGIPVYLAPRVESHHLVDHALSVEDYIPPPKETLRGI